MHTGKCWNSKIIAVFAIRRKLVLSAISPDFDVDDIFTLWTDTTYLPENLQIVCEDSKSVFALADDIENKPEAKQT